MKIPTLHEFRTSRNVLFWGLHAAGWAAYGITQYFGALLYDKPASYARKGLRVLSARRVPEAIA